MYLFKAHLNAFEYCQVDSTLCDELKYRYYPIANTVSMFAISHEEKVLTIDCI